MPRFIPPPGPGRPKGSKSRRQLAVEAKLEELGCDPITAMATLAMTRTLRSIFGSSSTAS